MEHQIGEELIIQKINQIFDEVAQDRQDFEESYMSLSGYPGGGVPGGKRSQPNTSSKESIPEKPDMVTTSLQVNEQSLIGFDKLGLSTSMRS